MVPPPLGARRRPAKRVSALEVQRFLAVPVARALTPSAVVVAYIRGAISERD